VANPLLERVKLNMQDHHNITRLSEVEEIAGMEKHAILFKKFQGKRFLISDRWDSKDGAPAAVGGEKLDRAVWGKPRLPRYAGFPWMKTSRKRRDIPG
jgi:hypothetical protein